MTKKKEFVGEFLQQNIQTGEPLTFQFISYTQVSLAEYKK